MLQGRHRRHVTHLAAIRRVFWAALWLAIVLIAIKAYYLGVPPSLALADSGNYLRSLAAISYVDVLFAAVIWAGTRTILALAGTAGTLLANRVDRRADLCRGRGLRGRLCRGQRRLLRHLRRLSHLPAARARRQPADAQLVGRRASDAARHHDARRPSTRVRRAGRSNRPLRAAGKQPLASRGMASRRYVIPLGRLADPGAVRIFHRLDDAAGSAHRRESALGAHLVVVAGRQRRRDRAPDRRVPRRRSQGFRSDRAATARRLAGDRRTSSSLSSNRSPHGGQG